MRILFSGDPARAEYDRLASLRAEKQKERRAIATAPLPSEDVREALLRFISEPRRHADGTRALGAFQSAAIDPAFRDEALRDIETQVPICLLAELMGGPEAFADRFVEAIERRGVTPGLPLSQRRAALAAIDEEITELRRQAERCALEIEADAGDLHVARDEMEGIDRAERRAVAALRAEVWREWAEMGTNR